MIRFANRETAPLVRQMWKTCFDDTEDYMNLYFSKKYKEENTLIYFEQEEAVASLQMLPSSIIFYGKITPFYYLAGLCTLPDHRKRGYMEQLILRSYQVMKERGIPLAILVPAEKWLFGFYEKYGFEQVFDKSDEPTTSLESLLQDCEGIETAYKNFSLRQDRDFYVQKSFDDFEVIIKELQLDDFRVRYNLAGMARIMDAEHLLKLYATANRENGFTVKILDGSTYHIQKGAVELSSSLNHDFEVSIRLLCRLLFGYKTDELEEPFSSLFPKHHPVMNLMLE